MDLLLLIPARPVRWCRRVFAGLCLLVLTSPSRQLLSSPVWDGFPLFLGWPLIYFFAGLGQLRAAFWERPSGMPPRARQRAIAGT